MKFVFYRSFLLLIVTVAFLSHAAAQQTENITVTGTVVSMKTGEPLSNIIISDNLGRITIAFSDTNGNFQVNVPDKNIILIFSFADFKILEVPLQGRAELYVQMVPTDQSAISDPMPTTYGQRIKKDLTEGIAHIPEDLLRTQADESLETLIQGIAPGAQVIRRSGYPGSGAELYIRGASSINAGSKPLYIVDGLIIKSDLFENTLSQGTPYNPLIDINPEDIESMTILKDGFATSTYGARASNGVVLINTYKGSQGASTLDFTAHGGVTMAPDNLSLLNAGQFRELVDELGFPGNMTPSQVNAQFAPLLSNDPGERFDNNTDWQSEIFNRSVLQNYHLRLKGGDGISRYMFTVGYTDKDGIIENSYLKRLTSRFNLDYLITTKLTFSAKIAYTNSNAGAHDQGNSIYNPIYLANTKAPIFEAYNREFSSLPIDSSDFFGKSNPIAVTKGLENSSIVNRFIGTAALSYEFTPNLKLSTTSGMDYFRLRENRFIPLTGVAQFQNRKNQTSLQISKEHMFTNETLLEFRKRYNYIHTVSLVGGFSLQTNAFQSNYGSAINTPSDEFTSLGAGAKMDSIDYDYGKWNTISYLGIAHYGLLDRYFISANLRIDGSSRFGQNNRLGYFPGVAAAWLLSSESFMQEFRAINMLKLRASYGISGNDNIGDYAALSYYIPANYQLMGGYRPGNLRNPDLKWEQTAQMDVGVDLSVFSQRLSVTADYYNKVSSDLLTYERIPWESGFDYRVVNMGTLENNGIELGLHARILQGSLNWTLGGNINKNTNLISELPDGDVVRPYGFYQSIAREGESLGSIYGYKVIGIYQDASEINVENTGKSPDGHGYQAFQPGDLIFDDINKDGEINDKDRTILGSVFPDLYGGFYNTLEFKGFNLTTIFSFSMGNESVDGLHAILESMSNYDNQTTRVLDRWKNPGDNTMIPRAALGDPSGNSRMSDRWVEDGSYVALKTASLSYTFPESMLDNIFLRKLVVYVSGQNLLTSSSFNGYHPDFSTRTDVMNQGLYYAGFPHTMSFIGGIRVGF